MKILRLVLTLALLAGLWGCNHSPNSVPTSHPSSSAASSSSAEPVRLLTPSLVFEGQTYYLSETDSTLPADVKIAFTCTLKEDGPGFGDGSIKSFLLRLVPGSQTEVMQAFPFGISDGQLLMGDLYGDGHLELFTSDRDATAPTLKITRVYGFPHLRYSNGMNYYRTSSGQPRVNVFKIDGEITQLFEHQIGHGVAGAIALDKNGKNEVYCGMAFDFYWADLYGNGRPVFCQVCDEVDTPKSDPKHSKHTRQLWSYWVIDAGSGQWREVSDRRKVDADVPWPQSLFGILAALKSDSPPQRGAGG